MPSPQDTQLQRMCAQPETLKKSRELLQLAQVKTRPGSGYDIGVGASGLPPICAYIASQELNNGDISQKVAQAASCLNNKVFSRTYDIVRKALSEDSEPRKLAATTYVSLIRSYTISMVSKVAAWMEDAERALVLKEVLSARYTVDSPLVKCAIFFWVCRQLKISQVESSSLVEKYELSPRSFDSIVKILTSHCDSIAKNIQADMRKSRSQKDVPATQATSTTTPTTTPRVSPRKPRLTNLSPSKSAMKGKASELSPSKILAQKRGVFFEQSAPDENDEDDEMSFPQTPTKRRKVESPPIQSTAHSSAAKRRGLSAFEAAISGRALPSIDTIAGIHDDIVEDIPSQPGPSTPRRTPSSTSHYQSQKAARDVAMDIDPPSQDDILPSPHFQPRRFRPVFLDRKQWDSRDPRIRREWPAMKDHAKRMSELYGHPFAAQVPDFEMQ